MALKQIYFDKEINPSLQVGDTIYYAVVDGYGIMGNAISAGGLKEFTDSGAIVVDVDDNITIPVNAFIFFSKPIQINESNVKGYYADITLMNHSKKRAELFAISSEVVPSSK